MKKIILALLLIGSSPSLFCMDLDGYGSQFITKEEHESNFTIRSSCYMTGYLASFLYSGFACHTLINNQLSAGDKILIGLSIPMTWLLSTLCAAKKDFIGVRVTEDNPDNAPKINALLNGIIPKPPTTILHNITEERIIAIPKDISKMLYDKARITSCNVANKEKWEHIKDEAKIDFFYNHEYSLFRYLASWIYRKWQGKQSFNHILSQLSVDEPSELFKTIEISTPALTQQFIEQETKTLQEYSFDTLWAKNDKTSYVQELPAELAINIKKFLPKNSSQLSSLGFTDEEIVDVLINSKKEKLKKLTNNFDLITIRSLVIILSYLDSDDLNLGSLSSKHHYYKTIIPDIINNILKLHVALKSCSNIQQPIPLGGNSPTVSSRLLHTNLPVYTVHTLFDIYHETNPNSFSYYPIIEKNIHIEKRNEENQPYDLVSLQNTSKKSPESHAIHQQTVNLFKRLGITQVAVKAKTPLQVEKETQEENT